MKPRRDEMMTMHDTNDYQKARREKSNFKDDHRHKRSITTVSNERGTKPILNLDKRELRDRSNNSMDFRNAATCKNSSKKDYSISMLLSRLKQMKSLSTNFSSSASKLALYFNPKTPKELSILRNFESDRDQFIENMSRINIEDYYKNLDHHQSIFDSRERYTPPRIRERIRSREMRERNIFESQIALDKSSSLSRSPKRQERPSPKATFPIPKNYPKSETAEVNSDKIENAHKENSREINELRSMITALEKKNEAVLNKLQEGTKEKIPKELKETNTQLMAMAEKVKKYKNNLSKMYQILIDKDKEKENLKNRLALDLKSKISSIEKANNETFKNLKQKIDERVSDIERLEKTVVDLSDLFLVKNYESKKAELEDMILNSLDKDQQQEILEMLDYISEEEISNIRSIETLQQALQCSEYRRMELLGVIANERANLRESEEMDRLQEDLKIYENENCILSQKLENLESDYEQLKKKFDDSEKRLRSCEKFKTLQEEATRNMELELSAEKEMLKLCKEEIQENQKTINEELKTIQMMEESLREKDEVISNLKDILSEEKAQVSELNDALEAKHEALNQLIDEKNSLDRELSKKLKNIEKMKNEGQEYEGLKVQIRGLEDFRDRVCRLVSSKNNILEAESRQFKSYDDVKEFLDKLCQNYHRLKIENEIKKNEIDSLQKDSEFYHSENSSLKNSLSNLKIDKTSQVTQTEIIRLQAEIETLKKKMNSSSHERKSLLAINESIENEMTELKRELSLHISKLKEKEEKIHSLESNEETLENKLIELNKRNEEYSHLLSEKSPDEGLKSQIQSLNNEISMKNEEIKQRNQSIETLNYDIAVLKDEIQSKSKEYQIYSEKLQGQSKEIQNKNEEIKLLKTESQSKTHEIQTLKEEVKHLKGEIETQRDQILSFQSQISSISENIKEKERTCMNLEKDKSNLKKEIERHLIHEKENEHNQSDLNKEIEALNIEITILKSSLEDKEKDSNNYLEELQYVKDREHELINEIEKLNGERTRLENEIKISKDSIKGYEGKLDEAYSEIKAMNEEITKLKGEKSKSNIERTLKEEDFLNFSQKSSFLEEEIDSQKSRIMLLQQELDLQLKRNDSLEKENKLFEGKNGVLSKEISSLKESKIEALQLVENKNNQLNKLQNEINELKRVSANLKEKEKEIDDYKLRNKTLTNKLSTMQAQLEDSKGREERMAAKNFELEESLTNMKNSEERSYTSHKEEKSYFKRKIATMKRLFRDQSDEIRNQRNFLINFISKSKSQFSSIKDEFCVSLDFIKGVIRAKNKGTLGCVSVMKSNLYEISNSLSGRNNSVEKLSYLEEEVLSLCSAFKECVNETKLDIQADIHELNELSNSLKSQISNLNKEILKKDISEKEKISEIEKLHTQIKGSTMNESNQVELYTQKYNEVEKTKNFLERELEERNFKISNMAKSLQESDLNFKRMKGSLEGEISQLNGEIERMKKNEREKGKLINLVEKQALYISQLENFRNNEISNLSAVKSAISSNNGEVNTLNSKLENVSNQIASENKLIETLQKANLGKEFSSLENKISDFISISDIVFSKSDKLLGNLVSNLNSANNAQRNIASKSKRSSKSKTNRYKDFMMGIISELKTLKAEINEQQRISLQLPEIEVDIKKILSRIETIQTSKKELAEEMIEKLNKLINSSFEKNGEIDATLNSFKEVLAAYLEERDQEVEELKEEMQFLTNNLDLKDEENQSVIIELEEEKRMMEAKISALEAQIASGDSTNQLASEIALRESVEKANIGLNELLNALNSSLEEMKDENESLKSTLSLLHSELEQYKVRFGTLEQTDEDEDLEEFKNYTREDIKELKDKLERTTADLVELQGKFDACRKKADKAEEAADVANKKVATLKDMMKIEDFEEEFQKMKEELAAKENDILELKTQLKNLQMEFSNVQDMNEQYMEEIQEFESNEEKLMEQNEIYKNELADLQAKISDAITIQEKEHLRQMIPKFLETLNANKKAEAKEYMSVVFSIIGLNDEEKEYFNLSMNKSGNTKFKLFK